MLTTSTLRRFLALIFCQFIAYAALAQSEPDLQLGKSSYLKGEDIEVNYSAVPEPADTRQMYLLNIVESKEPLNKLERYQYLREIPAGKITLSGLSVDGHYEVRLLRFKSIGDVKPDLLKRVTFTVGESVLISGGATPVKN